MLALEYVAATGAKQVHLMAGLADPADPAARQLSPRSAETAERLASAAVTLMIEPINDRDMPGYFLNDFAYAVAMTLPARDWLRAHGARHILFKICSTFDSTDRGSIGPVMDALRGGDDAPLVLFNSAFPETGRTLYRGNLYVGDLPLNESPLKYHLLNPMPIC